MSLRELFVELAEALVSDLNIEQLGRQELLNVTAQAEFEGAASSLPAPVQQVMQKPDAHPVCGLLGATPLPWAPPQTSSDPKYLAHSNTKVHVELLGPDGLVRSSRVRLGVYGILPHSEYGIRTHPAEEVFIMLAGQAWWKRGDEPYKLSRTGDRSYHPSMLPHATKTAEQAFMSIYIWRGDISTKNYQYRGIPA